MWATGVWTAILVACLTWFTTGTNSHIDMLGSTITGLQTNLGSRMTGIESRMGGHCIGYQRFRYGIPAFRGRVAGRARPQSRQGIGTGTERCMGPPPPGGHPNGGPPRATRERPPQLISAIFE
jgi:hypothetical protein